MRRRRRKALLEKVVQADMCLVAWVDPLGFSQQLRLEHEPELGLGKNALKPLRLIRLMIFACVGYKCVIGGVRP